ncbi:MAG: rod shape-determining protein MreD [Candidatus Omnitrophica bacterium]|nr:rod shape-determining protein MreD [Candidatus Omnitrophota bacterium]
MRKTVFILMAVFCALLQANYPPYFMIAGVKPDLLLLCAVMAALLFDLRFAVVMSITAGLLKDTLGADTGSVNTVLFVLWASGVSWFSRKISMSDPLFRMVVVAFVTFLHNLSSVLIYAYLGRETPVGLCARIVVTQTLYTSVISLLVCHFIQDLLPVEKVRPDFETHPW